MLKGPLEKQGYDWWWHNFTTYNQRTGKPRVFFIEYFVMNPGLGYEQAILGQLENHKKAGVKPSYALIKVGTWGENPCQIHNFYPIKDWSCPKDLLDVRIGDCRLTETHMKGFCEVSTLEAKAHPEYMCDAGAMTWDIQIHKKTPYHVGYGGSKILRWLNAFEMFWHAEGIRTEYSGVLTYNGEHYDVIPEKSYGYADKNWGKDFTSPWLWISSCHLKSLISGKELTHSAIEFGGGRPKAFGFDLGRKLLGCVYYEGQYYDFNFTKFWTKAHIDFEFMELEDENIWKINGRNTDSEVELVLKCPKKEMVLINYEAPNGEKRHNRLWNGGTGYGEMKLYHVSGSDKILVDHIDIQSAGCEYGEYQ